MQFPNDILREILSWVDINTFLSCAAAGRRLRSLTKVAIVPHCTDMRALKMCRFYDPANFRSLEITSPIVTMNSFPRLQHVKTTMILGADLVLCGPELNSVDIAVSIARNVDITTDALNITLKYDCVNEEISTLTLIAKNKANLRTKGMTAEMLIIRGDFQTVLPMWLRRSSYGPRLYGTIQDFGGSRVTGNGDHTDEL